MLDMDGLVADSTWPVADCSILADDAVTIGVQVNGKLRATITLPKGSDKTVTEQTAMANDDVLRAIDGKDIRKVIVVPDRIVNVVVG